MNWILSLVCIGLLPLAEPVESGEGNGWAEAEKRWIAHFRANGARLVNGTDGGEGLIGWGSPEERRARAQKSANSQTAEERSNTAKKREAAKTQEERSAWARRMNVAKTLEHHRSTVQKRNATISPGQRSVWMQKRMITMSPAQLSDAARKGWQGVTAEERTARAKRGHATRKHAWGAGR